MPSRLHRFWLRRRLTTIRIIGAVVMLLPAIAMTPGPSSGAPLPPAATGSTFAAGSLIVDLGGTQTQASALKPYGFAYDLIVSYKVPINWAIADGKSFSTTVDAPDFTASVLVGGAGAPTNKTYSGSAFIVPEEYVFLLPPARLAYWRGLGVRVDVAAAGFDAPDRVRIANWPRAVLDAGNGKLAIPYYTNAGIPATMTPAVGGGTASAYTFKTPAALNVCDDLYVMPHADPTWATHSNLKTFNLGGGAIWSGCHAVSVLENVDNAAAPDGAPDLNFLSVNGLVPFGAHGDGSPPYTYSTDGSDPFMQFLGSMDGAQENGSEQIYLPKAAGWRPTTRPLVWDDTQADVPLKSPGKAAKVVYGRGYGLPTSGFVMYEGGHSINKNGGTGPDIAAQRAFLNLNLVTGYERSAQVTTTAPAQIGSGQTVTASATVTGGSPGYGYVWTSSCGGVFGTPSGTISTSGGVATTTFTAPSLASATDCALRLVVTDGCGRVSFGASTTLIVPPASLAVTKTAATSPIGSGATQQWTVRVTGTGPGSATGVVVSDTMPAGATLASVNWVAPATGTCDVSGRSLTCRLAGDLAAGASADVRITATIDTADASITNTATRECRQRRRGTADCVGHHPGRAAGHRGGQVGVGRLGGERDRRDLHGHRHQYRERRVVVGHRHRSALHPHRTVR